MENIKTCEAGGFVSCLAFKNGLVVPVKKNDIVIFVGPNNVGKSQTLKDINELCKSKAPTMIVDAIQIVKYGNNIEDYLEMVSTVKREGSQKIYVGLGYELHDFSLGSYARDMYYGLIRPVFVAYLNTVSRLTICNPAEVISRKDAKRHPIHYAATNRIDREWLSQNYKKAFGNELVPHTLNCGNIPLCIGESVKFDKDFIDEQTRMEAYAEILDTYKQVQTQGDGIKSFTGILLYLMIKTYCTYLIDEPESFLHPPQAKIMGQIIGQTLEDNQQAFISTHSEDIIKGLLDVCPDRVKIIRITREGDINNFAVLENEKFSQIWNDPLLKHSNIMSSLFHGEVVLCESDSDCKMYSIIENYMKQKSGKYSETLFLHCGGKHRMAKVVTALRSLNVEVKLIPDMDVMNDEGVFRGIVEALGASWDKIQQDYRILVSNLHSSKEKIDRVKVKSEINRILDDSTQTNLSEVEIKEIRSAISTVSKWGNIKRSGMAALPAGDATAAFKRIDKILKDAKIFLVPVGELECFVKEVGGHGPEWVNAVLEKYQDLEDDIYSGLKQFIGTVCP